MQEPKYFHLENIDEVALNKVRQTSISWKGRKQIYDHREPDIRLNGGGKAVFGALALISQHMWQGVEYIGEVSPLLTEKGITSALWMRTDEVNLKQLAQDARILKNHTATHIGWIIPLPKNKTEEEIKKIEESAAVIGFWGGAEWMNNPDIALLNNINIPIILDVHDIDLSVYQQMLKVFKALKKRPFILNAPFFHPRDYPDLVGLQAIGRMISNKKGYSIGGIYLPIISHIQQLNEKEYFWQQWLDEHISNENWQLNHIQQQVFKAYESFSIAFKGRKMAGYDADIVILDKYFIPQDVIVGGSIQMWKKEMIREYNGAALNRWSD